MAGFAGKLKKDLSRNPKKTGMLGLMCVVAVYFWVPLVIGSGDSKKKVSKQLAQNGQAAPAATATSGEPAEAQRKPIDWEQLNEMITADQQMQPAELTVDRDPFLSGIVQALAEQEAETEDVPAPEIREAEAAVLAAQLRVTPESLDLKLGGTIVGGRMRVATINGKAFREQSLLTVGAETRSEANAVQFLLAEVHRDHVILERNGERFELKMPQRTRAGSLLVGGVN